MFVAVKTEFAKIANLCDIICFLAGKNGSQISDIRPAFKEIRVFVALYFFHQPPRSNLYQPFH